MNQEKFISSYIELLNSTLTEAIQKNLTILAQKNVLEQELEGIRNSIDTTNKNLKLNLEQKEKEIQDLKNQLNEARLQKELYNIESNELKKNAQHIDTFKSELVKSRSEIDRLNKELYEKENINQSLNKLLNEELSKPLVVTKKTEKPIKKISIEKQQTQVSQLEIVKDAGSF